ITRSTPPSMSTTVCRTRPVDRHFAAPTVRLANPLVIAESWSDRSTGRPSEAARVSPSTDTARACATSGTRRAKVVSNQLSPPSSRAGSLELVMVLLDASGALLVTSSGGGEPAGQTGQAGAHNVGVGWRARVGSG